MIDPARHNELLDRTLIELTGDLSGQEKKSNIYEDSCLISSVNTLTLTQVHSTLVSCAPDYLSRNSWLRRPLARRRLIPLSVLRFVTSSRHLLTSDYHKNWTKATNEAAFGDSGRNLICQPHSENAAIAEGFGCACEVVT